MSNSRDRRKRRNGVSSKQEGESGEGYARKILEFLRKERESHKGERREKRMMSSNGMCPQKCSSWQGRRGKQRRTRGREESTR